MPVLDALQANIQTRWLLLNAQHALLHNTKNMKDNNLA
jgi:hypothetical protein